MWEEITAAFTPYHIAAVLEAAPIRRCRGKSDEGPPVRRTLDSGRGVDQKGVGGVVPGPAPVASSSLAWNLR